MHDTVSALTAAGAIVITITDSIFNSEILLATCDSQKHEYRENLDGYLASPALGGTHPHSFKDLYSSDDFLVIPAQYPYFVTAFSESTADPAYAQIQNRVQNVNTVIENIFRNFTLDALIYPQQGNLVVKIGSPNQHGRNGIMAAVTGFPVITIPAGFSPPSAEAPIGVPIGMEILGLKWTEQKLLNIARMIAETRPVRRPPKSTEAGVGSARLETVPEIVPNCRNIPREYPRGKLQALGKLQKEDVVR